MDPCAAQKEIVLCFQKSSEVLLLLEMKRNLAAKNTADFIEDTGSVTRIQKTP